jgi:uncharacterized BrkB/YihY/UPF0761 family membrane protein
MSSHDPDSVNTSPDAAAPGRVERATALAFRAGDWAERRVPGVTMARAALERERLAAAGLLAGGIAYRLFLWLLPFGLVVAAVASFWIENDRQSAEEVGDEFGLTAVATRSALDAIAEGSRARWYFLLVGVPLLLWFSAGVVRALRLAFSVAWGLRPGRLRRPLRAVAAFNGTVVGLFALSLVAAWLREQIGGVGLAFTLLLLAVYVGLAAWVLNLLPHDDAPWTALLPGAALVAVGFQALHLVVVLYLAPKVGRSSELYGALGTATVLLLWLYLIARLLVASAFLNAALWERRSGTVSGSRAPSGAPATTRGPR